MCEEMVLEALTTSLTVVIIVVALLFIALVVFLCVRSGPCGPQGIGEDDQKAALTFADLYRLARINVEDDLLEIRPSVWGRYRTYHLTARPATHWGDLIEGSVRGFLVQPAKDINYSLQAFQHRVWKKYGDDMVHWPTIIIAMEWRLWAMGSLQKIERPSLEAKEEITQRVLFIEESRNLQTTEVSELRNAKCWDETDDLSLLLVFRDHVKPLLQTVLDTWESFELQQSFGMQLHNLKALLDMTTMSSLRFIEVALRRDEIRVHSKLWRDPESTIVQPDESLQALVDHIQAMFEAASTTVSNDTHSSAPDSTKAAAESSGHPHARTSWEFLPPDTDEFSQGEQRLYDSWMSAYRGSVFGLSQEDYEVLITRYVLLHRLILTVAEASVITRRMARFAQIGGELFLAKALNKDHVLELLTFASDSVEHLKKHMLEVGEQAQTGWETLRRGSHESNWCSTGPMDSVRLALAARLDTCNAVAEAVHITKDLKSRAEQSSSDALLEELNQEMTSYLDEWEHLKARHQVTSAARFQVKQISKAMLDGGPDLPKLQAPSSGSYLRGFIGTAIGGG